KGVRIIITNEDTIQPVEVGYHITETLLKLYPKDFNFKLEKTKNRLRMMDLANGTDKIRQMFEQGASAEQIIASYQTAVAEFKQKRAKYLLYE
ncbi:MAG: DUF1343 domain-containing protein, partial [Candidatus Sumerlaeia bacterium]|nr:DUF1343 domain-containing protein [Candidatus Sumerlaeia bacterium]